MWPIRIVKTVIFLLTLVLIACDDESPTSPEEKKVEITYIPEQVRLNENFAITGINFSSVKENNKIFLLDSLNRIFTLIPDSVLQSNPNLLYTTIPDSVPASWSKSKIVVSTENSSDTSEKFVTLLPEKKLKILSFSPQQDSAGQPIVIYGQMFSENGEMPEVSFNGDRAIMDSIDIHSNPQRIYVKVPNNAVSGQIRVKTKSQMALSYTNFTVINSKISKIIKLLVQDDYLDIYIIEVV